MTKGIGHNSGAIGARLRTFCERVERLEEEKTGLLADIREIYSEAKGAGGDRDEMEALLDIYKRALNM